MVESDIIINNYNSFLTAVTVNVHVNTRLLFSDHLFYVIMSMYIICNLVHEVDLD